METYDPLEAPDAEQWLALDDTERAQLVEAHHEEQAIEMPAPELHAMFHVIVENQLAADDPPATARTLARMMEEGLDRHDALHAIGSVLAERFHRVSQSSGDDSEDDYAEELERLTAKEWCEEYGD